jgi:prepilin-type N-terminal cleavage/methylation domain-containing protein
MNNKGFSLIEVVVAVAIFLIVVIGVLTMFSHGYKNIQMINYRGAALNLAQEKLEDCRENNDFFSDGLVITENNLNPGGKFLRVTTISLPQSGLWQVEVNVSWTEPQGNNQTLGLSTYIAY